MCFALVCFLSFVATPVVGLGEHVSFPLRPSATQPLPRRRACLPCSSHARVHTYTIDTHVHIHTYMFVHVCNHLCLIEGMHTTIHMYIHTCTCIQAAPVMFAGTVEHLLLSRIAAGLLPRRRASRGIAAGLLPRRRASRVPASMAVFCCHALGRCRNICGAASESPRYWVFTSPRYWVFTSPHIAFPQICQMWSKMILS